MTVEHGFIAERSQEIPELHCTATIFRHQRSGARLLSVRSDDENKVFGVSFRTPASDSTGVAHILEHSVLCGSEKYPVKEPFVELIKGSLQTFLNAMTYPDKTCYPVASANQQDFYNLVDVYLDAVFHPLLTPEVLMQEGWHNTVDAQGRLTTKGVVFNEMKGAYSSPDSLLQQYSQQSLFPDITYGHDSGGHPEHITDLTWDDFSAFYRRHYHPANSYIFFYGDDPEPARLQRLDAVLSAYSACETDSAIALQPAFSAPVEIAKPYAVDDDAQDIEADTEADDATAGGRRCMFTVNVRLGEMQDPEKNLAWHILEQLLIGLPSSPLRKILLDSGLGEDLTGAGLEDELREHYFSVGLKGIGRDDIDQAEGLIWQCLKDLVAHGIDQDEIAAAINTVEFALREQNTGSYPRGLVLMFEALSTWLYDGDPLALWPFEAPLAQIKRQLSAGQNYFEKLIADELLANSQRSRVILYPDPALALAEKNREQQRLAEIANALDTEQKKALQQRAEALQKKQEQADQAADLAKIPRLKKTDLPVDNTEISSELGTLAGVEYLYHDLPTRGVVYLDLAFDLRGLPTDLLPYVGIFGRALLELGTATESAVDLTRRIARETGGIEPNVFISARQGDDDDYVGRLVLRGKSTSAKTQALIDVFSTVLGDIRFDDPERLRQIVLESKARSEQHLIPAGHSVVAMRMSAHAGVAGWSNERVNGVEQLFFLRQLAQRIDTDFASVVSELETIRNLLLRASTCVANLCCEASDRAEVEAPLKNLLQSLNADPTERDAPSPLSLPTREGLSVPSPVHYAGQGGQVFLGGYRYRGSDMVVTRYLGTTYLWDRVRVQGGAYGAFCSLDRHSGQLILVSYRDPNVDKTLQAYAELSDFLRVHRPEPEELEKSIVGAIGEIDRYRLPDAKSYIALLRHLLGDDAQRRAGLRAEVLATQVEDFHHFAEAVDWVIKEGQTCVLGAEASLRASAADLSITKVI